MEQIKEQKFPFNDGQGIYTLSDAIISIRVLLGRAINYGITADEIKDRDSECKLIESHKHWYKEAYQYISLLKEDLAIKEELRNQYSILYYHTCVLCDVLECQDKDEDFFVKLDCFTAVNSFDEPFKLETLRSVKLSYPFIYEILRFDDLIKKALPSIVLGKGGVA